MWVALLTDRINNKLEKSNLINEHALNREPVPLTVYLLTVSSFLSVSSATHSLCNSNNRICLQVADRMSLRKASFIFYVLLRFSTVTASGQTCGEPKSSKMHCALIGHVYNVSPRIPNMH